MSRKTKMVPLGNMASVARPVRVKSSTNKGNDHLKNEGVCNEDIGSIAVELDESLSGYEKHMLNHFIETGDERAFDALED